MGNGLLARKFAVLLQMQQVKILGKPKKDYGKCLTCFQPDEILSGSARDSTENFIMEASLRGSLNGS